MDFRLCLSKTPFFFLIILKMITKLISYVSLADKFGVPIQLRAFRNEPSYRTLYGGLTTIIIYTIGALYFFFLLIQWQTKQLHPKVDQQTIYSPEGNYLKFTQSFFTLSVQNDEANSTIKEIENRTYLNTFEALYYGENGMVREMQVNPPGSTCGFQKQYADMYQPLCLDMTQPNQTWMYTDATRTNNVEYEFYVKYCVPSNNSNCINKTEKAMLIDQYPSWRLTTISQDVDLRTGEVYTIPSDYYFLLKKQYYIQLKVRKATVQIDDGIIFENLRSIDIVKDFEIIIQNSYYGPNDGPHMYLSLDNKYYLIRISYPKLGEVLATLGSTLEVLLIAGLFLNKLNDFILMDEFVESRLKSYFPTYSEYNIKKTWLGKISSISRNGQLLSFSEQRKFLQFVAKVRPKIEEQLNIFSILNSIHRLQLAMWCNESREAYHTSNLHYQIKDFEGNNNRYHSTFPNEEAFIQIWGEQNFQDKITPLTEGTIWSPKKNFLTNRDDNLSPRIEDEPA